MLQLSRMGGEVKSPINDIIEVHLSERRGRLSSEIQKISD
jgi:hypothetical protein